MTQIIKDLQKQSPGSAYVVLYELELPTGGTYYFHPGTDATLTTVQFRDKETPGTIRTYQPLPAELTGLELSTTGTASRPSLSISNIALKQIIGTDYEAMLGLRFRRRRTLEKFLYGESADANPPVEYVSDVYYIDRIATKNKIVVVFELSSPYDIEGVQLPYRKVLGGGCPWKYQGASAEVTDQIGGCTWNTFSSYAGFAVYFNAKDEPVVSSTAVVGSWGGSGTKDNIYTTTTGSQTKVNNNGTQSTGQTVTNYWQALSTGSLGTPTDSNSNFRRARIYTAYSSSGDYNVYLDSSYNEYVTATYDGGVRLFQKTGVSQTDESNGAAPEYNSHWQVADACGKRLESCVNRFSVIAATSSSTTVPSVTHNSTVALPFGGFPGSKLFS